MSLVISFREKHTPLPVNIDRYYLTWDKNLDNLGQITCPRYDKWGNLRLSNSCNITYFPLNPQSNRCTNFQLSNIGRSSKSVLDNLTFSISSLLLPAPSASQSTYLAYSTHSTHLAQSALLAPSSPSTHLVPSSPSTHLVPSSPSTHLVPSSPSTHLVPSSPSTHLIKSNNTSNHIDLINLSLINLGIQIMTNMLKNLSTNFSNDTNTASVAESDTGTNTASVTESDTGTNTASVAESDTGTNTASVAESDTGTNTASVAESDTGTNTASVAESDTGTNTASVAESNTDTKKSIDAKNKVNLNTQYYKTLHNNKRIGDGKKKLLSRLLKYRNKY